MQRIHGSPLHPTSAEDRAFFARLAAINAAFEAARAGRPAQGLAEHAAAIDDLLGRYFIALTSSAAKKDPQ
jgi:hypothetical protein